MSDIQAPVEIIGVPFGFGQYGYAFGYGPIAIMKDKYLPAELESRGVEFSNRWVTTLNPNEENLQYPEGDQLARTMLQNFQLADYVSEARNKGRFVLAPVGACSSALGVVGGLNEEKLGLIWFDGHADNSTPETSTSGFFDGMPVAIINGQAYKALRETIPGFHTIPAEHIVSIGMHDLLPNRPQPLGHLVNREAASHAGSWRAAIQHALDVLSASVDKVYIHIDTDSLDRKTAAVTRWSQHVEGGMSDIEMIETLDAIFDRVTVAALSFAALDPSIDPRSVGVVSKIMAHAAARGAAQGSALSPSAS